MDARWACVHNQWSTLTTLSTNLHRVVFRRHQASRTLSTSCRCRDLNKRNKLVHKTTQYQTLTIALFLSICFSTVTTTGARFSPEISRKNLGRFLKYQFCRPGSLHDEQPTGFNALEVITTFLNNNTVNRHKYKNKMNFCAKLQNELDENSSAVHLWQNLQLIHIL